MTAPTLIATSGSAWGTTGSTTRATGSLSWVAADWIIGLGMTENNPATLSTPTATGLTLTDVAGFPTNTGSTCKGYAWAVQASGSGSSTFSSSAANSASLAGIQVWVFRGCTGIGATVQSVAGVTPSISLSLTGAQSAVVWAGGDGFGTSDTTVTFTPSGGTQRQAAGGGGVATLFCGDWGDQGSPATTSFGLDGATFSTSGPFTSVALEVLGSGPTFGLPFPPAGPRRNLYRHH